MTKKLIIDTSSEYCILALADADRILSQSIYLHENQLSRSLLLDIASLLEQASLSLRDIEQIDIGVGPGSYTGTRVGVAVAKSLSFGLSIPLRGFCSLIAFLPDAYGRFASILPAKSGLYYLMKGIKDQNTIHVSFSDLVTPEQLQLATRDTDFVTTKQNIPLISECNPRNVLLAPSLPSTDLIYLHVPT